MDYYTMRLQVQQEISTTGYDTECQHIKTI